MWPSTFSPAAGLAWDPLDLALASQGSDSSTYVHARAPNKARSKDVFRGGKTVIHSITFGDKTANTEDVKEEQKPKSMKFKLFEDENLQTYV